MKNRLKSNNVKLSICVRKQLKLAAIPVIGYFVTFVVGCINMYRLKRWLMALWIVVSLLCAMAIYFPIDYLFQLFYNQFESLLLSSLVSLLVIIAFAYIVSYLWIWLQQGIANLAVKPNKTTYYDNEIK